jgi:hypothetical protein
VLLDGWRRYEATGEIPAESVQKLFEVEERDSVFADIKPELWGA